jgi:hypothetical protein
MKVDAVPCCPVLDTEDRCDVLTFDYRLNHPVGDVNVEVIIRARLERCSGELTLGDLVHSTTLLPGEKVRLFTANRRNRFTFDRESEVTYRHEQTSEESYYMSAMSTFMSDLSVKQQSQANASSNGSFSSEGGTSGFFETIFSGPSVEASGSYNASSSADFLSELSRHAESSSERSVQATRAASSVSVGEVQSRTHAEGESESSFEASTRTLCNPNRCRAITFFSYQINKRQTVRFVIERIDRRVIDPAGDTAVTNIPPKLSGEVSVIPQGVLATNDQRVQVEALGRGSVAASRAGLFTTGEVTDASAGASQPIRATRLLTAQPLSATRLRAAQPISAETRAKALQTVDAQLVEQGLINEVGGNISRDARRRFSIEISSTLPTPGILVKGCLDNCGVCEPELAREIELDLAKKELENKLLERQIDLLEQSQEYRCCPEGESESDEPESP